MRLERTRLAFEEKRLHHERGEVAMMGQTIEELKSADRLLNAPSVAAYNRVLIG